MVATPSIDNSEWVMPGVVRDPQTGALLRVNADGSINVSGGGGGGVGTGTTVTGGASITLNSTGIQFNGSGLAGTVTAATNATLTLNSAGLSISVAAPGAATNAVGLNTAQTNVTWTVNTSGISFNAGGYAGTGTAITGGSVTLNTAGISINLPAYLTTARSSNDAVGLNTAGTNITWTVNSSGISINAGGYNGTGFTSATTAGTAVVATNNSAGLSMGVPAFITTGDLSQNSSKYAGINSAITGGSMTVNTSGISINIPAAGGAVTISSFGNLQIFGPVSGLTQQQSRSLAVAFNMPQAGSFSFVRVPVLYSTGQVSNYTSNATMSSGGLFLYETWNAVVYSLATGANSTLLTSVASGSGGFTAGNSYSFDAVASGWSVTQSVQADAYGSSITAGTSTQYSQTSASLNWSTGIWTNFSSLRLEDIRFANSLAAGAYWLLVGRSSSSTASGQTNAQLTNLGITASQMYGMSQANAWWNAMGDTAGGSGGLFNNGVFSTAGGGTTANLPISALSSTASNPLLYFQMLRTA